MQKDYSVYRVDIYPRLFYNYRMRIPHGGTQMSKKTKKYIIYAAISVILFTALFLLTKIPAFSGESENIYAVFIFVPGLHLVLLLHGVLSALLLERRAKLVYIIVSPFLNLAAAIAMMYGVGGRMPFKEVIGGLFEYPVYIITSIYICCGWLGMLAVVIFKKLRAFSDGIFKHK